MNSIDANKLLEHLSEKHTGHMTDYRLRMAIDAARVDIGPVIRREIAAALRNVADRYSGWSTSHHDRDANFFRRTADELDPPSAEPVSPKPEPRRYKPGQRFKFGNATVKLLADHEHKEWRFLNGKAEWIFLGKRVPVSETAGFIDGATISELGIEGWTPIDEVPA